MASADAPMKGIATLLEAFAKLRTERDVELLLVTKPAPGGRTEQLIDKLSIGDAVRFVNGVSDRELVDLMGSAEVACVPSLYEGFSLPTAELMACGRRWWSPAPARSPRSSGPTGSARTWSPPATWASSRRRWPRCSTTPSGGSGWAAPAASGSLELFSWRAVAVAVAAAYEEVIADYRRERDGREAEEVNSADR